MEDYTITAMIGEGSFGKVYKAIEKSTNEVIALKIISKTGRSDKGVRTLRKEWEIQVQLNHPNIIRMITSFETNTKIGVVTEFAVCDLNKLLIREGTLNEHRVQRLTFDLMSALYYLHSHRILHRDLKPQNILLDQNECAKLCDFGLARNMTLGTHVLTSIKGTPLYMAPELMSEKPYDHLADLWSLGCILYECLTGEPPFCTTSFIRLVRLIKYENVKWPTFLSQTCISFIQGLLEKNPVDRLCWPNILQHPFIIGNVVIPQDYITDSPFTHPLSASQIREKEIQKQKILRINQKLMPITDKRKQQLAKNKIAKNNKMDNNAGNNKVQPNDNQKHKNDTGNNKVQTNENQKPKNDTDNNKIQTNENQAHLNVDVDIINDKLKDMSTSDDGKNSNDSNGNAADDECEESGSTEETDSDDIFSFSTMVSENDSSEDYQSPPIENDEWIAFLHKSMQEILDGDTASIKQQYMVNTIVTPLRNTKINCKVIECIAQLLSLPLILDGPPNLDIDIQNVYLQVKLVANLVYASKLMCYKRIQHTNKNSNKPSSTIILKNTKKIDPLTDDELKSLITSYRLICYLVHLNEHFLSQFCDAVAILGAEKLLIYFLSHGTENDLTVLLTNTIVALLSYVLRELPENAELVETIIFDKSVNLMALMKNSDALLRSRVCILLRIAGRFSCVALQNVWTPEMKEILECLVYDSDEEVRNTASSTQMELELLTFYNSFDIGKYIKNNTNRIAIKKNRNDSGNNSTSTSS